MEGPKQTMPTGMPEPEKEPRHLVLVRANPTLVKRIEESNVPAGDQHIFPAEMSVDDIAKELPAILKTMGYDAQKDSIYVDGTTWGAMEKVKDEIFEKSSFEKQIGIDLAEKRIKFISQEEGNSGEIYDAYADRIAEVARGLAEGGDSTVYIIKNKIADHCSLGLGEEEAVRLATEIYKDPKIREKREAELAEIWHKLLKERGVKNVEIIKELFVPESEFPREAKIESLAVNSILANVGEDVENAVYQKLSEEGVAITDDDRDYGFQDEETGKAAARILVDEYWDRVLEEFPNGGLEVIRPEIKELMEQKVVMLVDSHVRLKGKDTSTAKCKFLLPYVRLETALEL